MNKRRRRLIAISIRKKKAAASGGLDITKLPLVAMFKNLTPVAISGLSDLTVSSATMRNTRRATPDQFGTLTINAAINNKVSNGGPACYFAQVNNLAFGASGNIDVSGDDGQSPDGYFAANGVGGGSGSGGGGAGGGVNTGISNSGGGGGTGGNGNPGDDFFHSGKNGVGGVGLANTNWALDASLPAGFVYPNGGDADGEAGNQGSSGPGYGAGAEGSTGGDDGANDEGGASGGAGGGLIAIACWNLTCAVTSNSQVISNGGAAGTSPNGFDGPGNGGPGCIIVYTLHSDGRLKASVNSNSGSFGFIQIYQIHVDGSTPTPRLLTDVF